MATHNASVHRKEQEKHHILGRIPMAKRLRVLSQQISGHKWDAIKMASTSAEAKGEGSSGLGVSRLRGPAVFVV